MKVTRKQKLRKKEEKKRRGRDRRLATTLRLFDMYGLREIFDPLDWLDEDVLFELVVGPTQVELAPDAKPSVLLERVRSLVEQYLDIPREFVVGDKREDEDEDRYEDDDRLFSFNEFFRGYFTVPVVVEVLLYHARSPRSRITQSARAQLEAALVETQRFDLRFSRILRDFGQEIDEILEQVFRLDQQVVWHTIEPGEDQQERRRTAASRIVLHHQDQRPLHVPVADGRRKVYPCLGPNPEGALVPTRWNPARLGIGESTRDLPVLVSDHAIARLHERVPLAPNYGRLHRLMAFGLSFPRLHPAEDGRAFLAEMGPPGKNLGYFVVEIYADFVFVKTFLFLTMQGTPESRALRQKLGLSRSDIEYFKLDHFYTLVSSDLVEDPELKRALAECGCGHLLDCDKTPSPFSWLTRYGARLRREIGLPAEPEGAWGDPSRRAGAQEVEQMIAYSRKLLKHFDGWTV